MVVVVVRVMVMRMIATEDDNHWGLLVVCDASGLMLALKARLGHDIKCRPWPVTDLGHGIIVLIGGDAVRVIDSDFFRKFWWNGLERR